MHIGRGQRGDPGEVILHLQRIARIELALGQLRALSSKPADLFQPIDLRRNCAGRSAAQFILGRAIAQQLGDFLVERSFGHRPVNTRLDVHLDLQEAGLFELDHKCRNRNREALAADQRIVEPRGGEPAQHLEPDIERRGIGIVGAGAAPDAVDAGQRNLIGHLALDRRGQRYWSRLNLAHFGTARDAPEPLFDQRPRGGGIDIARQDHHYVARGIVTSEPAAYIGQAGGVQISHRTDG